MVRQSQARVNQAHVVQAVKPRSAGRVHQSARASRTGNQAAQRRLHDTMVQPKLAISQPGDRFEQEADRVADTVMRMAGPIAGTPPAIQRMCSDCGEELQRQESASAQLAHRQVEILPGGRTSVVQRLCKECKDEARAAVENGEEDEKVVTQAKLVHPERSRPAAVDSTSISALSGGGRPLPAVEQSFFESRLGHDFGGVRIHTDARADELARSVDARAFTHGSDIVFRAGEYVPGTSSGRHLLIHELAHTIQQGASPRVAGQASAVGASLEVTAGAERSASLAIQRVCEVTAPPPMDCPEALTSVGSGTPILFGLDSSALSPADQRTISAIAAAWHTGGEDAVIRIDGFASCDGAAAHNWVLSCQRAQTVATEIETPSDGSPGVDAGFIEIFANGETDQFSATSPASNRRAMISSFGTPPPGPHCPLTITGPDDVDHFCAAYVPSDAAACGVFPAPNITLTAAGAAAGATLTWSVARGAARASIAGAATGPTVNIQGDAASVVQGDVTVQVTDGTCTTTHALTVREPSAMTAAQSPSATPTVIRNTITYTVQDQFGNPMGAGICIDETVTLCSDNHPELGAFRFGDAPTDAAGQATDNLVTPLPVTPPPLCTKLDQILTAGGCGPLLHNTILFQPGGVTLVHNDSCAVGDPCP